MAAGGSLAKRISVSEEPMSWTVALRKLIDAVNFYMEALTHCDHPAVVEAVRLAAQDRGMPEENRNA